MTSERLDEFLRRLPSAAVGVIGDFCLDAYWQIDLRRSERSIETGEPTHPVREQRYSLGGAGNVVANLRALGVGRVAAFGVVGADPFGQRLLDLLRRGGADPAGMVVAPADDDACQTLVYGKPYIEARELSRFDMGAFNRLSDALADALLTRLAAALPALDVVVVNEQVENGIHTPRLRERLRALMQAHSAKPFFFDGRHGLDSYPEARLKLNAAEACRLAVQPKADGDVVLREEAVAAARALFERAQRPVFVTRGDRGAVVADETGVTLIPGLLILGRTDTVGAGDSFLAGAAAATAIGATPVEAAHLGNFVAGVTVTKLRQTGTAAPDEVRAIGREPDYVYEPELADNARWARAWEGSEIEIVEPPPARLDLHFAIFDHDGTISTLRQGWEEVMEPMMLRAILGARYADADEALFQRTAGRVRRYIDQTTGVQTLVQMQGLIAMVREAGLVPGAEVLDAAGYKAIYNRALMERVEQRLAKLQRGELAVEDLTLKNAVALLRRLRAAGLRLYLASGTDQADVEREVAALGYAELFEGRIVGAVGDVTQEAKRLVLERILGEIGAASGRVVTFGDGPVEMRETRKHGGFAIGVASDEVRRFALNPAKRARLIRAGACALVPDFSQLETLLRFLGVE